MSRCGKVTFAEALKQITRILNEGKRRAPGGVVTAEAEILLAAAWGRTGRPELPRMGIYSKATESLPPEVGAIADRLARERAAGIPLQYVTGTQTFLEHVYEVNPSVLIPRPETEGLVLAASEVVSGARLGFEIGLGSGIISIELLSRFPDLEMKATELSAGARELAARNARRILGAGASRLGIVAVSDRRAVCEPFGGKADFLISNPPYLSQSEEADDDVRDYEPSEALWAPDEDPLFFYRAMAGSARQVLSPEAPIFAELPHERAGEIGRVFSSEGWDVTIKKDLAGRDRVLIGRQSASWTR
jgi:release factor glutamine methyltransferase